MSLGLLLASGIVGFFSVTLSDEAFLNWGWRVAFLLSAVLLAVGGYMRSCRWPHNANGLMNCALPLI